PYHTLSLALQATLKVRTCHSDCVLCREDMIRISAEKSVDFLVNQFCWNICMRSEDVAQKWVGHTKIADSSIGMHFGKLLSGLRMGENNLSFLLPLKLQLRWIFKAQYLDLSIGSFEGILRPKLIIY